MRYLTDFNEIYDDDRVWTVISRNTVTYDQPAPEPGTWVELFDDDGSRCLAIVVERYERTIDCKIDWSTWESLTQESQPSGYSGAQAPRLLLSQRSA